MYAVYSKIASACEKNKESKDMILLSMFKSFVLEIGISVIGFYDQSIRYIIHNEKNFLNFLLCFQNLIYLKYDQNILKYKCKNLFYFSFVSYYSKKRRKSYR